MTQEDKKLLLQDLCGRLPYGVKCSFGVDDTVYEITGINPTCCGASEIQATHIKSSINGDFRLNSCKPYLFPLSSMTEEQREEFLNIQTEERQILLNALIEYKSGKYDKIPIIAPYKQIEWLNKNNFDYRGLIEKGLAIDCTNLNIY